MINNLVLEKTTQLLMQLITQLNMLLIVVIPGSSVNSDLTTPIPFIKNRFKKMLYEMQRLGDTVQWLSDGSNFYI